jgi:hypothetical protein
MNLRYAWIGTLVAAIILLIIGAVVQYALVTSKDDALHLEFTIASQGLWLGSFGILPLLVLAAISMILFNVVVVLNVDLSGARVSMENFVAISNNRLARLVTALEDLTKTLSKKSAKLDQNITGVMSGMIFGKGESQKSA